MKSICIKSNNKSIIDYLLKDFSCIDLDSLYLSNNTFKLYDNVIVHYKGNNIKAFENAIYDSLTRCILFFYERKIIKNILQYNYFYFTDLEKQQLFENCSALLNSDPEVSEEKYKKLYHAIREYLSEHHSLVLNGFVNFRIKEYKQILDYHIDLCVSNFLIEREYYEFINILHLYVQSKESEIEHLHLIYVNKESILIDDEKNIISVDDHAFQAKYLSDISFSSNDYCLNTLLNLLPKTLTIHLINEYEDEFITTLKLIFEHRVTLCTDCDICHVYRLTSNVIAKE